MNDNWIESALTQSDLYLPVLEKISKQPRFASKNNSALNIILKNPDEMCSKIATWINTPHFKLDLQKQISLTVGEKTRTLYTAPWPDRIILMATQRLLSEFLEEKYSPHLYSFRKGRGTIQAHQALRKYLQKNPHPWIGKRDISQYGDSIAQAILFQQLESHLSRSSHPKLYRILEQGLSPAYLDSENQIQQFQNGIPSGSPLTPVLENLYLMGLDSIMTEKCKNDPSIFYARYGDDFVFAATHEQEFKEISQTVDAHISNLELKITEKKKIDLHLGIDHPHFEWLGVSFASYGLISCKSKHFRSFYDSFITNFQSFINEIARYDDIETSLNMLKPALHQFLDRRQNPTLPKLLLNKTSPIEAKKLDHNIRLLLVRWLTKRFKIKKSVAWKKVRQLKVPSLNFQRRMSCKLK
jgi:hypothetical protein